MTDSAALHPDRLLSVRDVFGIATDLQVPAFSERDEHVPEIDTVYRFNPDVTLAILAGFTRNRRVMVQGLHGTGKSTHIEQVAARLNWPCLRVNLDGHISRLDLVGKDAVVLRKAPRPSYRRSAPPEGSTPTWGRPGAGLAKASKSPSFKRASSRGRCSGPSRWCSTNTTPAGPT